MFKKYFFLIFPLFLFSSPVQISIYDLAHIVSETNNVNIVIDEDLSQDVTLFFTSPVEGKVSLDTFKILSEKKGFDFKRLGDIYFLKSKENKEDVNETKIIDYQYISTDIQNLSPETVIDISSSFDLHVKHIFATSYLVRFDQEKSSNLDTFLRVVRHSNNRYVRLTGEIVEINNDDLYNKGLDFSVFIETINRFGDLDVNFFSTINQNEFIKDYLKKDNKVNLTGFLNFLKTEGIARTVTTPNLLVSNYERSKFHSGQKIPIRSNTTTFQNSLSSPYTTMNYSYLEVGLVVDVGARIFNQVIELDFKLDHTTVDKYTANEQVITSNKTFHSKFNVLNHKRIVIAGLSKVSDSKKLVSVPLVSDIPFLGELFKSEYSTQANTSLIIFLTADLEVL